jgi:hypothetical protein
MPPLQHKRSRTTTPSLFTIWAWLMAWSAMAWSVQHPPMFRQFPNLFSTLNWGMEVNLTNNQTITILYLVYLTWKSLHYCILNKSLINTSTLQKIIWQTIKFLLKILLRFHCWVNRIGGVMVSVLASSAVDHGSGRTKNYKIGICCFSAKYAALRRKSQDW